MKLQNLEFKLLKKLKILNYLKLKKRISFAGNKVIIPIINTLGYPNLFLNPNWLYLLINEFIVNDEDTFVDVGANIGQTLIAVKGAKRRIQYIGFEPSVSCCYYLKLLIQENKFTDCQVYNFALSNRLQHAILETNGEADPTGSMVENLRPSFFKYQASVFALNYDSLNLNQPVACIKIDVEGGELEVLMGMQNLIKQNRPYIICEILDSFSDDVLAFTQDRADQVCTLLKTQTYSIIQIVQTEEADHFVSFNEIDAIKIKQWDRDSVRLNDYVFYPSEKKKIVIETLKRLCH